MLIKKHLFILIGFSLFLSCSSDKGNIAVMAYYVPGKDYNPAELPLEKLTHIIFSFTEVIDGEMKFKKSSFYEKLELLVQQKHKHPHLKVMIACGGWGGSEVFSDMAASPERRKKFVESSIRFVNEYNLDGIDIDWEYPGLLGAGNPHRAEDKETFTVLMHELRQAMDETGRDLILTFASAGWKRYYDHIELTEVMKYADYINVMTYDFVGGRSPFTAHHTNLGLIKNEDMKGTPYLEFIDSQIEEMVIKGYNWEPRSAEKIISYCINSGVDPRQIVIGCAFYGRAWKGVPPENYGLYQPNKGVYSGWSSYSRIRKEFENKNNYIRHWDSVAKAPYLYNAIDSIFISYDDTASVKLKTRYALQNKLGGIMFWQLGNDTKEDGSLLDAIVKELNDKY